MKRLLSILFALVLICSALYLTSCQQETGKPITETTIPTEEPTATPFYEQIVTTKTWECIGDSITWLNDNKVEGGPAKGYQTRLQEKIQFGQVINKGVSGATMLNYSQFQITKADIYTIALGVNDWGSTNLSPVGTLEDYIDADGKVSSNYAQCLKRIILRIRKLNPEAIIILMTPRRAYNFNNFLPAHSTDANAAGIYLHDFADIIIEIGKYEGLTVVDLYYDESINDDNLAEYSYDDCLHPNDKGMQHIADLLYPAIAKYLKNQ